MKPAPKPNIITVWESYGGTVQGPDKGGWRKARCPIHEDRSASASINEDECRWHCFTCDKSGDAIDLVREITGVTRYVELVAIVEGFLDGSDREVRGRTGSASSLLPHRQGTRPGRRAWKPPWSGL